jgi:hypothetical protein
MNTRAQRWRRVRVRVRDAVHAKVVRFSLTVRVILVPSRKDMTPEEKLEKWWGPDEIRHLRLASD